MRTQWWLWSSMATSYTVRFTSYLGRTMQTFIRWNYLTLTLRTFPFLPCLVTLVASIAGILSALVGLIGTFRENRTWLSWYNLMLWPVFALYLSVGYIAFRRSKNHLRAHLKDEWIHSYSREQRLLVQRNVSLCALIRIGCVNAHFSNAYVRMTNSSCFLLSHVRSVEVLWVPRFKLLWRIRLAVLPNDQLARMSTQV